jgi:hypothetical protein
MEKEKLYWPDHHSYYTNRAQRANGITQKNYSINNYTRHDNIQDPSIHCMYRTKNVADSKRRHQEEMATLLQKLDLKRLGLEWKRWWGLDEVYVLGDGMGK